MFSSIRNNQLLLHVTKCIRHYSSTINTTTNNDPHTPVLCEKAISYLDPKPGNVYIDMTFGAGGHSKKILNSTKNVKIFALDRDPISYEYAKLLNVEYPDQIIPLLGKFSEIPYHLKKYNYKQETIDGILFDFGCSSMQFNEADRGFSISKNGPLDMRMDRGRNNNQITAADVLAKIDENDLIKILRIYGEEKAAKKIARTIIEARSALYKIETTKQLADLVASCMSDTYKIDKLQRPMHVATKTFQALRIFVNNELNEINYGMILAHRYLKKNGRLVTITFHSLEDTIVKRHINGNVIEGLANPVPLKYCNHDIISYDKELVESLVDSNWKQLHKHVIVPDDDEIMMNTRSRSAKLRAAIKIK